MIKEKPMFSMDVKISGKIKSLPVYETDTHDTLVERFCGENSFKEEYTTAVKDKIIGALIQILRSGEIAHPTKDKISKFLKTGGKPESKRSSKRKLMSENENETPFKKILNTNKSSELKRSSPNRHKFGECGNNSMQMKESAKGKQEMGGIQKNLTNPSQSVQRVQHRQLAAKKFDNDLIRAYQTIYRKSREGEMKKMAKEYLENCGYFQKQENKKMLQSNAPSKNQKFIESKNQQKEKIENEPSISGIHKDELSLTKYEILENQEPSRCHHSGERSRSRSRKRISYQIDGEEKSSQLVYNHLYTNQNYCYPSSIHHSFEIPRPSTSLSYDRIPYYPPPPENLLYQIKYDCFYQDEQVINSRSRSKGKKFKYL